MTHHHHDPGHRHPPATLAPSALRMSVADRLGVAAIAATFLWASVFWALQ